MPSNERLFSSQVVRTHHLTHQCVLFPTWHRCALQNSAGSMRYLILDPSFHSPLYYEELNRSFGLWGMDKPQAASSPLMLPLKLRFHLASAETQLLWLSLTGFTEERTMGNIFKLMSGELQAPFHSWDLLGLSHSINLKWLYRLRPASPLLHLLFLPLHQNGPHCVQWWPCGKSHIKWVNLFITKADSILSLMGFSKTHLFPYVLEAQDIL